MTVRNKGDVLLLGMVYADEFEPKRGQEYRDRVRCDSMEKLGYNIRTLDDKHSDADIDKHCTANFAGARRMLAKMGKRWEGQTFDHVILDYFFSPVSWARERWTDGFYQETLPLLALNGFVNKGAKVWLPALTCIRESLSIFRVILEQYYNIRLEGNPKENPLYLATESVTKKLMKCPDMLTNETQIAHIFKHNPNPFYVLEVKSRFDMFVPQTVVPARRNARDVRAAKREKAVAEAVSDSASNDTTSSAADDSSSDSENESKDKESVDGSDVKDDASQSADSQAPSQVSNSSDKSSSTSSNSDIVSCSTDSVVVTKIDHSRKRKSVDVMLTDSSSSVNTNITNNNITNNNNTNSTKRVTRGKR